jgi:hypothetical protein
MVFSLLILIYLALLQSGPRVCAFLQPAIFHSRLSRLRLTAQFHSRQAMLSSLAKLKVEAGRKENSPDFQRIIKILHDDSKRQGLLKSEKEELKSILTERVKFDRGTNETAHVLRSLDGILSARNNEDKRIVDSLIVAYIGSSSKSFLSFPFFLTSLKKLDYRWNLFDRNTKERIVELFDGFSSDEMLEGRAFRELIDGIAGLEMNWNDLQEKTRSNLLRRLKNIYGQLDLTESCSVIFKMDKLAVHLSPGDFMWETVLKMTVKMLTLIDKRTNLKERGRIVSYFPIYLLQAAH